MGRYNLYRQVGRHVQLAGHGPLRDGAVAYVGSVPSDISIDAARSAAELTALNLLATIETVVRGELENLAGLVSLTGYVRADSDFTSHPTVIDAASQVLLDVLGDRGQHARAAVGVSSLPFGIPVELSLSLVLTTEAAP